MHDSEIIELYKHYSIEIAGVVGKPDLSHTVMLWSRWYHAHRAVKAVWEHIKIYWSEADYWFDKIKPDIVHLNSSPLAVWAAAARVRNIPVVCHIRESLAPGYLGVRRWLTKTAIARWSNSIVAISTHDAKPWCALEKTHVVYNAVDPHIFTRPSPFVVSDFAKQNCIEPYERTILFLGGLSREKGTLTILKAFEQVLARVPDARLIIAGYFNLHTGAQKKYLRQIQAAYPAVAHAVELTGPTTQVPELMSRSSVLVFPATVGHFARPIIEAGFMGLPVVASNLSPLDELVLDNKTGFLVSPTDIEQWAEKLILLLENQPLATHMGAAAYDFCAQKFALSTHVARISELYATVLQETGTPTVANRQSKH